MMSSKEDHFSHFYYHRLSSEEINNDLIPQISELGKYIHLHANHFVKESTIAISYGKRLIITGENRMVNMIKKENMIEIIDVNPVKKHVLYFGSAIPSRYTPLLYLIHYAKKEIQVQLFITFKEDRAKHFKMISASFINDENTFMDLVKSVLISLQTHDHVIINNKYLLMTGPTKQSIETSLKQVGETNENTWSR
jgi:hypothetical protein